MKICIVAEGSYPFTPGGVSSWVQSLVTQMPEHEFVVHAIVPSKKELGESKYKYPGNLSDVNVIYLQDDDIVGKKAKRFTMTKNEREALRTLVFCENEQWEVIFDMFDKKAVSLNDLLISGEFYEIVRDYYNERFSRITFTDFLWTCRSMFLPIFTVMKNRPPVADIYHTVSTGYAGVCASLAGHINKKPVLLSEHGIYTREREEEIIRAEWVNGTYKDLWISHFYMLSRCVYERSTKVISLFEKAREAEIEIGCPEEKTMVVPNGVRVDRFENIRRVEEGNDFVNVGAIIRVSPIKDVKTMISAFHYAKEKEPRLRLLIIGNYDEDREYYNECEELLKHLGTRDVSFTGHVDIIKYLGLMDISLLTSISEGQPLSMMECMAAGIPYVCTQVGDCHEILRADDEENRCGLVVPIMSIDKISAALVELAQNADLRRQMGENGRRITSEFYRESTCIDTYKGIYESVSEKS